jgi:hypothetical protein
MESIRPCVQCPVQEKRKEKKRKFGKPVAVDLAGT